jgi:flavin reductase (DIM6/NTAB) family NADH-FMN oxidoreductase RutF
MKVNGNLEKFYQYAFPMQTVLITCNDQKGKTNIITVAWHTPISKIPPLYAISIAPSRYSHDLITETEEFTINFVPYQIVKKAHYYGKHSGRTTDKIKETNLTLSPAKRIHPPLIKDCYAHLECKLVDSHSLGDHTVFIGKVVSVQSNENTFENEILDINTMQPLLYLGANSYTTIDKKEKKSL